MEFTLTAVPETKILKEDCPNAQDANPEETGSIQGRGERIFSAHKPLAWRDTPSETSPDLPPLGIKGDEKISPNNGLDDAGVLQFIHNTSVSGDPIKDELDRKHEEEEHALRELLVEFEDVIGHYPSYIRGWSKPHLSPPDAIWVTLRPFLRRKLELERAKLLKRREDRGEGSSDLTGQAPP